MCGIVGFIGEKNAIQKAVEGLKCLEYRGYDSAGVFAYSDHGAIGVKKVGRLNNLAKAIERITEQTDIAIAHTRWATHGGVSEKNAHPHVSGKISIVHNGVIDNFLELKDYLIKAGRTFYSETDTEVIAHLIDLAEGDTHAKVRAAAEQLQGSYAIAVISADERDKIIVARKSSPLILGSFDNGAIVASDIQAILPYTNKMLVMDDDETAVVQKSGIKIYKNGVEISKDPLEIPWSVASAHMGKFHTFMEKEIHEQPVAIFDTMLKNNWTKVAEDLYAIMNEQVLPKIVLIACGTSHHACTIGAMAIEGMTGISAQAMLASEVKYSGKRLDANTLVIAVSQSGETADTIMAVKYAKESGAKIVSIINVLGSSLSRESDLTIYTAAGPEVSVASTKAFTSQLTVLMCLTGIINNMFAGGKMFNGIQHNIYAIADDMPKIFEQIEYIKKIAQSLIHKPSALFLGRGLNVPIAQEGALKLKEISYIHAEGMSSAELKHGPIALISEGYPVIMVAIKDGTYEKVLSNMHEVKARGARVIAIANEDDELISTIAHDVIRVPVTGELLYPMLTVVPLQLLALYTAWFKGTDVDKPRNLAKSVTVE